MLSPWCRLTTKERDDHTEHEADDDAGDDGEIESGIPALDPDIAGQPAQPAGTDAGPEGEAEQDDSEADEDEKFADFWPGLL